MEPHPLWEYPCRCAAPPRKLMEFDFARPPPEAPVEEEHHIELGGGAAAAAAAVNGMALWMRWRLDEEGRSIIDTGPREEAKVGELVEWDVHSKQGVHLFGQGRSTSAAAVRAEVRFDPAEADLTFRFELR